MQWMVKPGDTVTRGQIVCVVETQKGAIDVEIFEGGVIDELLVQPGTEVPVGTPLARLRSGDTIRISPPTEAKSRDSIRISPPAAEAPVDRRAGRASPAARNAARALGVDLAKVTGTGPGGAITLADVEHGARRNTDAVPGFRAAIAAAMGRSKREIPHYYLAAQIDLHRALTWLRAQNEARSVTERVLPVALFIKATALAAKKFPELNGFYKDGAFQPAPDVHVGFAISLKDGLIAPGLHSAADKPLPELMHELADLIQRARKGGLRSSELADPTLTLTSLGDNGAESVFGIIFPPQVSLIGFGRIVERPIARDGAIAVHPTVQLGLSADHRVSDGLRGSQFVTAIDRLLQEPEAL